MNKKYLLLTLILSLGFTIQTFAHGAGFRIMLSARLNGAQQIPSVNTNAVGVASLFLNASRDTLCLSLTANGLSGAIDAIHIHSGAAGTNGGVLIDLGPYLTGNRVNATLTGANLTPSILSSLLSGNTYINVHTAANPNGEIRGQITQESDWLITATLNGMQQVPPVNTNAMGFATFALSKDNSKLGVRVVADGLSGSIDAIHLHQGAMGSNGPVLADLSSFINGNTVVAELDPTAYLADLLAGNVYINLHTTANPNGEIRGQLKIQKGIAFDAWLDGGQQVPTVNTPGKGVMSLMLNNTFDTLTYMVQLNGLKSPATAAHLHIGSLGGNGGVAIDFTPNINGNIIMGKASGSSINSTVINLLFAGDIYVNIHNDSNANGEIRGQVYPLMRKSFVVEMNGMNQVPMVNTNAIGSGVISIDRNTTNAHIMIVSTGLMTSDIHLHKAAKGSNGGVIFDMVPFLANNGVFMYWKSTDSNPFTMAAASAIRKDSVYVNVHTAANPNGEIRGQIVHESYCYLNSSSVNEVEAKDVFTIYPNPVQNSLTVNLKDSETASLVIYNSIGQVVMSSEITQNSEINTSALNSGIYTIEIMTENGVATMKFIKE